MKLIKQKIICHFDCILNQIIQLIKDYPVDNRKYDYDYLSRSIPELLTDELNLSNERLNEEYNSMTKQAYISKLINRGISSVVQTDEIVDSIIELYFDFIDINNMMEINKIRCKLLEIVSLNYVLIL